MLSSPMLDAMERMAMVSLSAAVCAVLGDAKALVTSPERKNRFASVADLIRSTRGFEFDDLIEKHLLLWNPLAQIVILGLSNRFDYMEAVCVSCRRTFPVSFGMEITDDSLELSTGRIP